MPDPKLLELTTDSGFRAKVGVVLDDLWRLGEAAKIYEAKRTLAEQREKVRLGYSKTLNSFHVKRGSDGGGRAADVADTHKAWNASRRFWFIIGASAHARGVGWGGLFGLSKSQVQAFIEAAKVLHVAGWPIDHPAYHSVKIGWDSAHLQDSNNWPVNS